MVCIVSESLRRLRPIVHHEPKLSSQETITQMVSRGSAHVGCIEVMMAVERSSDLVTEKARDDSGEEPETENQPNRGAEPLHRRRWLSSGSHWLGLFHLLNTKRFSPTPYFASANGTLR